MIEPVAAMQAAFRFFLIVIGSLLAMAAHTHAASENGRTIVPPGLLGRSGIDGKVVSELVDGSFRAETMALQADSVAEQGGIAREEIAALAKNPADFERFIANQQRSISRSPTEAFPDISVNLLEMARLSYSIDPLNVEALRTIALGHWLHEDQARSRRIMRLASSLSKRDDITNMWLAQDYGRNGDASRMLASFDNLLRTSRRAWQSVIGLVVSTLGSEESHASFGKLLRRRPEWQYAFWAEFARNPVALANARAFFENSGISLEQVPENNRATLYSNLKRTRQYDTLFSLASLDQSTTAESRDLEGFSATSDVHPLGWTLNSQGTFAARTFGPNRELLIDARAGSFGIAAERIVRGGNDLQAFIRMGEPVPPGTRLRLIATCADSQKELANVNLVPGDLEGSALVSAQNCAFVRFEITFGVAQGRQAPLIKIAEVTLENL